MRLVGFLLAIAQVGICPAVGQTLEVVPSPSSPPVGSTLTVEVRVSGLGNFAPPSLGAFDLTLSFDPAVLSFTSGAFGVSLGDQNAAPAEAVAATGPGTGQVFEVSLLAPADLNVRQPDAFTLFTAAFNVVGEGATALGVGDITLGDENGDPFAAGGIQVVPGAITARPATDIPTLSGWGVALLIGALAGVGISLLRRLT